MAGIFKSLHRNDVRVTPFKTHKLWSLGNPNIFTTYSADYSTVSSYRNYDPLNITFDQGNPQYTNNESITSGEYNRIVHKSIDHLYYRDFYTNNKGSFGSGNINTQYRLLEDKALVISMTQQAFGEAIEPRTCDLTISQPIDIYDNGGVIDYYINSKIVDDGYGNLFISSESFVSVYSFDLVPNASRWNYTSSITKKPVIDFPFDEVYKYTSAGYISMTSSYANRSAWSMNTVYNNVSAINDNTTPDKAQLGSAFYFSSSIASNIVIGSTEDVEYLKRCNFENSDFAISFIIVPTEEPTNPSGSILISKQGPSVEQSVTLDGKIRTSSYTQQAPYVISFTSERYVQLDVFDRNGTCMTLVSTTSASLNDVNHIVAQRSGAEYTLYLFNRYNNNGVISTTTNNTADIFTSNNSSIYIGNDINSAGRGFSGIIDNVKFYNTYLTEDEIALLSHTVGVGSLQVGNVFYNHGMFVLGTSLATRDMSKSIPTLNSIQCRGTHTIWETEVACVVNPGSYNMSCNPTTQQWSSEYNQMVYKPMVTGSYFKPYVTTVGLYNDNGELLVVGKLSNPIQLPDNVDTTILVRYDK